MRTKPFTPILWLFAVSTPLIASTISLQPASLTVAAGQAFTMSVQISGVSDLYGYQFDLEFNPAVLAATAVTEGPFLGAGGPTIFLPGAIDNATGTISGNAGILAGAVSGVDGNGTLLNASFQALAAGTTSISFANVIALDSLGREIPLIRSESIVTVVPEPGAGLLAGVSLVGFLAVLRRRSPARRS
jgi:general secretion pathway protein D